MGWKQVNSERQGGKMLSTMEMESDSSAKMEIDTLAVEAEQLLFKREVIPYSLGFFIFILCTILFCYIGFPLICSVL